MISIKFMFDGGEEWIADWPAVPRIGEHVLFYPDPEPFTPQPGIYVVTAVQWKPARKNARNLTTGCYCSVALSLVDLLTVGQMQDA